MCLTGEILEYEPSEIVVKEDDLFDGWMYIVLSGTAIALTQMDAIFTTVHQNEDIIDNDLICDDDSQTTETYKRQSQSIDIGLSHICKPFGRGLWSLKQGAIFGEEFSLLESISTQSHRSTIIAKVKLKCTRIDLQKFPELQKAIQQATDHKIQILELLFPYLKTMHSASRQDIIAIYFQSLIYKRNQTIYREGATATHAYVVANGIVGLYKQNMSIIQNCKTRMPPSLIYETIAPSHFGDEAIQNLQEISAVPRTYSAVVRHDSAYILKIDVSAVHARFGSQFFQSLNRQHLQTTYMYSNLYLRERKTGRPMSVELQTAKPQRSFQLIKEGQAESKQRSFLIQNGQGFVSSAQNDAKSQNQQNITVNALRLGSEILKNQMKNSSIKNSTERPIFWGLAGPQPVNFKIKDANLDMANTFQQNRSSFSSSSQRRNRGYSRRISLTNMIFTSKLFETRESICSESEMNTSQMQASLRRTAPVLRQWTKWYNKNLADQLEKQSSETKVGQRLSSEGQRVSSEGQSINVDPYIPSQPTFYQMKSFRSIDKPPDLYKGYSMESQRIIEEGQNNVLALLSNATHKIYQKQSNTPRYNPTLSTRRHFSVGQNAQDLVSLQSKNENKVLTTITPMHRFYVRPTLIKPQKAAKKIPHKNFSYYDVSDNCRNEGITAQYKIVDY